MNSHAFHKKTNNCSIEVFEMQAVTNGRYCGKSMYVGSKLYAPVNKYTYTKDELINDMSQFKYQKTVSVSLQGQ
jgi:hypothetical protein